MWAAWPEQTHSARGSRRHQARLTGLGMLISAPAARTPSTPVIADIILIVAGLHALAALAHHYVLRDNVLRRMLTK